MNNDRWLSIGVLALALWYGWMTLSLPEVRLGDPMGPKYLPVALTVSLIVCGIVLFFRSSPVHVDRTVRMDSSSLWWRNTLLATAILALFLLYVVVFERLGFLLDTFLLLMLLFTYFNRGRWLVNVLTASIFSVVTYLIFAKLLGVTLPPGLIPL